jgi:hypothetical protein
VKKGKTNRRQKTLLKEDRRQQKVLGADIPVTSMQECINTSQTVTISAEIETLLHYITLKNNGSITPKKYLTQRRKERRGKTLQSFKNGSILTIALCVSATLR